MVLICCDLCGWKGAGNLVLTRTTVARDGVDGTVSEYHFCSMACLWVWAEQQKEQEKNK